MNRPLAVLDACAARWGRRSSDRLHHTRPDGRTLVFLTPPDLIRNRTGRVTGVDAWVELYDAHGHEIPIDPHRRIVNPPTRSRDGGGPDAAFIEAVWDAVDAAPNPAGWRTRGTVTVIYGDTSDGRVEGQSATYSAARQGTGNVTVDTTAVTTATGQFFSSTYSCYQQFWAFDTAGIPDGDAVSAVTFSLWMISDVSTTDFTIEARAYDWGATLTTADYIPGASLSGYTLLASHATSGIGSAGAYKSFNSQAAFLTVAGLKTGFVRFFTSSSRHRAGNTPTGNEYVQFSMAETTGTTQDPRLTVTHAAPPFTGWGVPL